MTDAVRIGLGQAADARLHHGIVAHVIGIIAVLVASGDLAELHSEYVHMLGNLTLLGYRLSVAASNQPFDIKCSEHYCKSEFALTRALTSRTSWDLEAIEERQKTLADPACSLWPRQ